MPDRKEVTYGDVSAALEAWQKVIQESGARREKLFAAFAVSLAEYTVTGFDKLSMAAAEYFKAQHEALKAAERNAAAAEASRAAAEANAKVMARLTWVIAFSTAVYTVATIMFGLYRH